MYRALLHAHEFPVSHTATLICDPFEHILQRWKTTKQMVHVVLRDNACNMAKSGLYGPHFAACHQQGCTQPKSCV